ncbi:YycH family regulatory protein [Vagococcus vulneris]|uniref:Regulatory protein YycH domain-containing protein n=1 Tax=Vagococcus vulneris TaxID=1977869 RepID=A0A429ZYY2_9ENTE|nr:two-component system activity regulator YycH [Vagococcus vulneris]RST99162.1 hypothetical protein CBF37_05710 [Vagococcus vulneris]
MTQIGERIVRISLILMVILSLILSWKIWTNPSSNHALNEFNQKSNDVIQQKKITDVYVPIKLFYQKSDDTILYTNRESLISNIQDEITNYKFSEGRVLSRSEAEQASQAPTRNVDLTFPTEMPISFYLDNYGVKATLPSEVKNSKFSRVILDFDNSKVYFSSRTNETVIEYIVDGNFQKILDMLENKDITYYPVTLSNNNVSNVYYLSKPSNLKIYSYIIATQSFTTFSKAFFNQSEDLYLGENGADSDVNLSNGEGESLTIQSKTGEVSYFGKLQYSKDDIYFSTFKYIENLGNTIGSLRYSEAKTNEIIYRNYVEGFPVFGNHSKGVVDIAIQNQKNVRILTNQETIQIPIPSNDTVTLPQTTEMLADLENHGIDKSKILDMQIGYEWQSNTETKQVVDLVPKWYLNYNGSWKSNEQLRSELQEGVVD